MHVAITVGTLLLGGWVLNGPPEEDQTTVQEQTRPAAAAPAVEPRRATTMRRGQERTAPGEEGERANLRRTTGGESGRTQPLPSLDALVAPTDVAPAEAGDTQSQPVAPTSGAPLADFSRTTGGGQRPSMWRPPTAYAERRGAQGSSGYRGASQGGVAQGRPGQPLSGSAALLMPQTAAAAPPADKAFSGFRPTSGVSPYMNLFRRDSLGTVDNYTTLVRPQLEQRFMNQQFGRDISGLERNSRMQRIDMQQLQRSNQTLQGVGTPQFYMNYGTYYPGYGQ